MTKSVDGFFSLRGHTTERSGYFSLTFITIFSPTLGLALKKLFEQGLLNFIQSKTTS